MPKKLTQENVVERMWIVHCGRYTYRDFFHDKMNKKSIITCLIHGNFLQTPYKHLGGQGCQKCGIESVAKSKRSDTENYLKKLFKKYPGNKEKYGYDKCFYEKDYLEVKIFCNSCQKYFTQTPQNHLKGHGCKECANKKMAENRKLNTEKYLNKLLIKRPNNKELFEYSKVKYIDCYTPILIMCLKCNVLFMQSPHNHMQGQGCPDCAPCSKMEEQIRVILKENNVDFIEQKKFKTCINPQTNYKLKFDFYLPDYNILIEYDGEQHFIPFSFGVDKSIETKQKNLEESQYRDSIKTQWAKENNIPLIRFSYKDKETLEEKVNKLIKLLKNNII